MPVDVPDATTVSEIVAEFEKQGYVISFAAVEGGGLRCGACRTVSEAGSVTVNAMARAEGPSDPADEAVVVIVTCPWCLVAGTAVLGYGPTASLEDADVLERLTDERPEGDPGVHLHVVKPE